MKIETRILMDKDYRWGAMESNDMRIFHVGSLVAINQLKDFLDIHRAPSVDSLKKELLHLNGHFGIIILTGDFIIAATDRIRSCPILYIQDGDMFYVSNSAKILKQHYDIEKVNDLSFVEFNMAGFVTGRETLYEKLYQLQAGEFLIYNRKSKSLAIDRYYRFYAEDAIDDENILIQKFIEINNKVFTRIIEEANGDPIYVPLSGGLDSRLVLCQLKRLGYDHLNAFSYGPKGNYDAKWAGYVAEKIDVPWYFIPYNTHDIRSFFNTDLRKNYWPFASHFCSLPFMVDEPALNILKQKKIIKDNSIIINGQSGDFISGGHSFGEHQKAEPQDSGLFSSGSIAEAVFRKHFSMNASLIIDSNKKSIIQKIKATLNLSESKKYNVQELVKYYELWEWQERQAKFVVNGQRSYDYFGFRWFLPLWESEYLDFWMRVSYAKKFKQQLYKNYLNQINLYEVFRNFQPKIWNWQGASLAAIPIGAVLKRIFGKKISSIFYHYASYFGKYHHHFAPFGFWKWISSAKRLRNPLTFYIEVFLKENSIKR